MAQIIRHQIIIHGAVQGIGFRPFIYRLAGELKLNGWVSNIPEGVVIEAEGTEEQLEQFKIKIDSDKPVLAAIYTCEVTVLDAAGYSSFEIRESVQSGKKQAAILPDIAVCPDCLRELFDPNDRRFRYPFINCTNCGPRLTIIEALPYDRATTSMKKFTMCPDCQKEYDDPNNRRFHAQPNACPKCGPHVVLTTNAGKKIAEYDDAVLQTADAIRKGLIVAVKGIGGFHLMADPFNDKAVRSLRERKHREEKPFALMVPTVAEAKQYCSIGEAEEKAMFSTHAPIVLVKKNTGETKLSHQIAPNNPMLGVMLPYSPLHHLLMRELSQPVIATSGNLSDEPICTENEDALEKLGGIADLFLLHDRPIVRHADDSIIRIIAGREMVIRRARGLAPLPVLLPQDPGTTVLAVGAHLKNTVALNVGRSVFVSQHIGDLETEQSLDAFKRTIADFKTMYAVTPEYVVTDKHPEYLSTQYAGELNIPVKQVQHHAAHIFSCMAENHLTDEVFGVSWDGTGLGDDGTIWGGEFFHYAEREMKRIGTFRSFPLPGGSSAIKEPRRSALGMLYEMSGGKIGSLMQNCSIEQFSQQEVSTLVQMMEKDFNSPRTSSAGRIFDAVSSLTGLKHKMGYEGQGAMELESIIGDDTSEEHYTFSLAPRSGDGDITEVRWEEMINDIMREMKDLFPKRSISRKFHNTMAEIIIAMAERSGAKNVVLSGGCFQNAYLTERTIMRLKQEGFVPYWHQRIPPNDGGISLGQLYGAVLMEK
ncbi:MAG: carbamoyltransferase HypF [Bacteroidota bacterium]